MPAHPANLLGIHLISVRTYPRENLARVLGDTYTKNNHGWTYQDRKTLETISIPTERRMHK